MNKIIVAFAVFFFLNVIMGGIMDGGGDIATTRLTSSITSSSTTVSVKDTTGFLYADYIVVEGEKIRYVSKTGTTFTVPTGGRGYDGTAAKSHSSGEAAYSPQANILNASLGFNVTSSNDNTNIVDVSALLKDFVMVTVPKLITWDFPQYRLSSWLMYIRIIFCVISIGFIIYLFYNLALAAGNLISRIFNPI